MMRLTEGMARQSLHHAGATSGCVEIPSVQLPRCFYLSSVSSYLPCLLLATFIQQAHSLPRQGGGLDEPMRLTAAVGGFLP